MAYSNDFIEHVLLIQQEEKLSHRATAKRFRIAPRTLFRWKKGERPATTRVRSSKKIPDDQLLQDVKDYPDAFQYERARRFNCHPWSIGRALRRLNVTRKKNG